MQVHAQFTIDNRCKIELMLLLGDDNLTIMNEYPNIKNLRNEIELYFNMQSKFVINSKFGTFC